MLTALLFHFPFPGPWEEELTAASHELARDIASEHGLMWKIWLEDRATGHAGGVYLFADAAGAERYREKHERRLSALGLTGVLASAFSVNTELSVLTMAGAALGSSSRIEERLDGHSGSADLTTNPQPARTAPVTPHAIKGSM